MFTKVRESDDTCHMTKHYLKLAIPAIVNSVFEMIVSQMNIIFIGRMGSAIKLAGVGLGSVSLNMVCLSVMIGFNGALETLVS